MVLKVHQQPNYDWAAVQTMKYMCYMNISIGYCVFQHLSYDSLR